MKKLITLMMTLVMCLSFSAEARRCAATTMRGTQCKREAKVGQYCTQHHKSKSHSQEYIIRSKPNFDRNGKPVKASNDRERCQSTTRQGTRCKLKIIDGTRYCPIHTNIK